ncbi:MAG: 7-cyano-7-deazaguanine synthase QueC [Acidobacteria bacterium]|nr:7-cyano-7-deazaguanine synthase QueC [Acidobacteriota bacterium]
MPRATAVVLMSGGMDSCVTAAIAARDYRVAALHVSYGQLTAKRERRAFEQIADYYHITQRLVADHAVLGQIGGSALTDAAIPLREADLAAPEIFNDIPTSYVPFRNAHFLAIAVSWAEVIGASKIFIGAVEPDSSGYPDCRPEYYRVFNELIQVGTKVGTEAGTKAGASPDAAIKIVTPLIHLPKDAIIKKGVELGAPLHLSWSCYRESETACGTCDSCALRLRAFAQAGVVDAISYRVNPDSPAIP